MRGFRFRIDLRDPKARLRLLLYLGALLVGVLFSFAAALQVFSATKFCEAACHEMVPYVRTWSQSSHSRLTCYACHGGGRPSAITLIINKTAHLKELPLHILDSYEKPINGESKLSLEMGSDTCLLCHDILNRKITASPGIIINHKKHTDKGIGCPRCHNRVAHLDPKGYETGAEQPSVSVEPEESQSGLTEEQVRELEGPDAEKKRYPNRMMMRYCFVCHTQAPEAATEKKEATAGGAPKEQAAGEEGAGTGAGAGTFWAPGRCDTCHPKGFNLRPVNHQDAGWLHKKPPAAKAMHPRLFRKDRKYCEMCHDLKTFCSSCHGVEMPHPENFKQVHGRLGKRIPDKCRLCHTKPNFCDACHHKEAKAGIPWVKQHFKPVKDQGAKPCFDCHRETYCSHCHVTGKKYRSIKGP